MGAIPRGEWGMGNGETWQPLFEQLVQAGRAATLQSEPPLWIAAERVPMLAAAFPGVRCQPAIIPPERERAKSWSREDALRELVRGQLEVVGPTTAPELARALGVSAGDVDVALAALEHEGFVLRGRFTPGFAAGVLQWCERRLLARIHRSTLDRLRREIAAVPAADYMRFLLRWQRLTEDTRAAGPEGLAAVLDLLDGFELPAGGRESDNPPAPPADYEPLWLCGLWLPGGIAWGGPCPSAYAAAGTRNSKSGPIRTSPVALFRRERGEGWRAMSPAAAAPA